MRLFIFFFGFLLLHFFALSQPGQQYQKILLSQKNGLGLLGNNVNDFAHDDRGFLWVATDFGLTRYAGQNSIHFTTDKNPLLKSNIFSRLLVSDSIIWATSEGEVIKVNTHTMQMSTLGLLGQYGKINDFDLVHDSTLMIVTAKGNLLIFNIPSRRLEEFPMRFTEIYDVSSGEKDDAFLLLGDEYGIIRVDLNRRQILKKYSGILSTNYSKFSYRKGLGLFHNGLHNIKKHDPKEDQFVGVLEKLGQVTSFEFLDGEVLVVKSNNQIIIYDSITQAKKQVLVNASNNEIKEIRIGTNKDIYAVTRQGLLMLRKIEPFKHVTEFPNSDTLKKVRRKILEDTIAKRLYFFHYEGVDIFDQVKGKYIQTINTFKNAYDAIQDSTHIYIATEGQGLLRFSKKNHHIESLLNEKVKSLNIVCLEKMPDGSMLLGTYHGLKRWDPVTKSLVGILLNYRGKEYSDFLITKIVSRKSDEIWISSDKGVFQLNRFYQAMKRYDKEEAIPFNIKSSSANVLFPSDSGMYVGLDEGLFFIPDDGTKVRTILESSFESSLKVISILKDKFNRLWAGTYKGIFCVDPVSGMHRAFNSPSYFSNDEFNRASAISTNDGSLYFGSMSEYSKINPVLYDFKKNIFKLSINDINITDRSGVLKILNIVNEGQLINLGSPDAHLEISFLFQDLINLNSISYFYKIDGVTPNWVPLERLARLELFNLPRGTLTIRLRAINEENFSSSDTFFYVDVPTKFYQTIWFYLLLLLALSILLYAFHEYRLAQLRKFLAYRVDLANELHDTIGTAVTKMIFAAEGTMREQGKRDSKLIQIVDYGRQVNSYFRDALWSIDERTDRLVNLVDRLIEIGHKASEGTKFSLLIDKQKEMPALFLTPFQKRNILMISHEAINNILKHSSGDIIKMSFLVKNGKFYFGVCDNGKGIMQVNVDNGYGIKSMKRRVNRINGEIKLTQTESWFCVEIII
jgi:signal transduction histidine kinase/ligand-binding sensor domain-containing protein